MANTPLYKSLKSNGTTIYTFPGAAEDISISQQNPNSKIYFSKYVLLNFPKQEISQNPEYLNFSESFEKSTNAVESSDFSESIVESLRNYVANQEVTVRESRLNNTEYYYDTSSLETITEKVFFKWAKKLNLIDFEPAISGDEYYGDLQEFESKNVSDDEYFPEYLWKERSINDYNAVLFTQTGEPNFNSKLEIEFETNTNFRKGDYVNLYNVSNPDIIAEIPDSDTTEGVKLEVLSVLDNGSKIIVDKDTILSSEVESEGKMRLIYHRFIEYIGEVNGVSKVTEANRSYTEIYAHIPDHTGKTPDILFRTKTDKNYKPGLSFPIRPSDYQSEIQGAESITSPIISDPNDYPGSYYAQYDTLNFTYQTQTGDELRRSGDYFGIKGDKNIMEVDGSTIDGITVDFNTDHYIKMNIPNRVITNFDQFNALEINNQPPKDFEFNAILWYYDVEDNDGNVRTNLYGISFLDNPENNVNENEKGLRFPVITKLVSTGNQDGTSYSYNLTLNYNIINENPNNLYNPEAINSLFSMNLYNEAMKRLSNINDNFLNIISEHSDLRDEIGQVRSLLYTQTDINTINSRMKNLEKLLRLYSTNQLNDSDDIEVVNVPGTPPSFKLNNTSTEYTKNVEYLTTNLFNTNGAIKVENNVVNNRKYLINIINNDDIDITLPNNERLKLVLTKDLSLNQSVDMNILPKENASENKKLDIFMMSDVGTQDGSLNEILILGDIDLPVFYNSEQQTQNSAYTWNDFNFDIDFDRAIKLTTNEELEIPIISNQYIFENSFKTGDVLVLNDMFVGTSSVVDYSGQYIISSVDNVNSSISLDISNNQEFINDFQNETFPYEIHGTASSTLSNKPYFSLNKGKKIKLTRVNDSDKISERYLIQINNLKN